MKKAQILQHITSFIAPLLIVALLIFFESLGNPAALRWLISPLVLGILLVSVVFSEKWLHLLAAIGAWAYVALRIPAFLPPVSQKVTIFRGVIWFFLMVGLSVLIRRLNEKSRKKVEAGNARNKALIDYAYDSFIGMNVQGNITAWNRSAEKMFGWKADEVVGKQLSEIIVPLRYREHDQRGLNHFLQTGEGSVLNKRMETMALHRDGREFPIAWTIYTIHTSEGIEFGSFLQDISETKKEERMRILQLQLAELLAKAQSLVEVSQPILEAMVKTFAFRGGELWIKAAGSEKLQRRAFSLEAPEMSLFKETPITIEDFKKVVFAVSEESQEKEAAFLRFDSPDLESLHLTTETGEQILFLRLADLKGLNGFFLFYGAHNTQDALSISFFHSLISSLSAFIQKKLAQELIAQTNKMLEEKVKLRTVELAQALERANAANRTKDEFLATISHELRTPMGIILGYVDLLLDEHLPPEIERTLKTIERNAKNQNQIISDLLDVSRIMSGKMNLDVSVVDLKEAAYHSVESVRLLASAKNIEVQLQLPKEPAFISGDSSRIQQVFWNLLTNAIKFSEKGKSIKVELLPRDGGFEVVFTDHGKGIDPSFLPHVFERFLQEDSSTTRSYGGLGLGLAIVRYLVEAHGGEVAAHSQGWGQGAQFKIYFPALSRSTFPREDKEKDVAGSTAIPGKKILIVEDESDTRQMLATILKKENALVKTADDVENALAIFKTFQPDLLLSDISMPGQSGDELIKKIRDLPSEKGGQVPALALSARALETDKKFSLECGFDSYLSKPAKKEDLLREVEKLLLEHP